MPSNPDPLSLSEAPFATIALAGQPNVGKSTVFNMLTGLNQHVGNWPGKTVEKRVGEVEHDGLRMQIIDLPGAYCLTATSPEELIAREYIIREKPDVVIVIINAASLERNLYLVAELLSITPRVVIGLNMLDVARQEGFEIEPEVLAAAIGVPVIPMVATRNKGVHELVDSAIALIKQGPQREPSLPEILDDHRPILARLRELVDGSVPEPYPPDWAALKLLEGDQQITAMMKEALPAERWAEIESLLRHHEDALIAVAGGRYEWIRRMTRAALRRPRAGRITFTQRLDRIATHPFLGLLALALVLMAIFGLTYTIGGPLQEWLAEAVIGRLANYLATIVGGPPWLSDLITNGIFGGVGTVLTFLPILAIFFIAMGILEDVGYMARAAYVMDRFMHAIGLHGKSFMPLFLGFGCNVPAVMGARIIESPRDRLLTILLTPLVPCTARLAVLAVLAPVFFPQHATWVSWGLTGLPLVVLALLGLVTSRLILKGEETALIMELPLYHLPNWRTIVLLVWTRLIAFVHKAGTVILAVSIFIWLLSTLPHGDVESSYLASVGRLLEPLGALMGLGWRAIVALLVSFVAKENSIAVLSVLYGAAEDSAALSQALSSHISPAAGLAFLVVQMLFIPCVATVAVIRQETGSWKWTLLDAALLAIISFAAGIGAYHLAMQVL